MGGKAGGEQEATGGEQPSEGELGGAPLAQGRETLGWRDLEPAHAPHLTSEFLSFRPATGQASLPGKVVVRSSKPGDSPVANERCDYYLEIRKSVSVGRWRAPGRILGSPGPNSAFGHRDPRPSGYFSAATPFN